MTSLTVSTLTKLSIISLISGLILITACVPPNTANTAPPVNSGPANVTPAPQPIANPADSARTVNIPVTLPVLDAMFTDEAFVQEMKQKLQLTDEQVQKLKDASRDYVIKLGDEDIGGISTSHHITPGARIKILAASKNTCNIYIA